MAPTPGELWDQRFSERDWPAEPDELLVELAGPLAAGRALDVGSGPGRNSLWLAARGWAVTAVDASGVALRQATERGRSQGVTLQTVLADVATWKAPASTYDLVVLANLHLPEGELRELLRGLADALVPGGHLFVVGHDVANLGRHGPSDPALLLTPERLAAALPADLVAERVDRVTRRRDHGDGEDATDVAVVAWAHRRP